MTTHERRIADELAASLHEIVNATPEQHAKAAARLAEDIGTVLAPLQRHEGPGLSAAIWEAESRILGSLEPGESLHETVAALVPIEVEVTIRVPVIVRAKYDVTADRPTERYAREGEAPGVYASVMCGWRVCAIDEDAASLHRRVHDAVCALDLRDELNADELYPAVLDEVVVPTPED